YSRGHLDLLQDLSALRIDLPQLAVISFPRGMPELAFHPGDPGDEAVGFDGPQHLPGLRIDLMDLAGPVLSHPERPFGPGEPRIAAAGRRGDAGEHAAGLGTDLLNAAFGDLEQVAAVKGRPGMRGDVDRAQHLSVVGIDGLQLVAGGQPDVPTVIADTVDTGGVLERPILFDDLGGCST